MIHALDRSEKEIIAGPMTIGDDDAVTKYRAASDGREFWAFNGYEVFYSDERGFAWLDEIWRLRQAITAATNEATAGLCEMSAVAKQASLTRVRNKFEDLGVDILGDWPI